MAGQHTSGPLKVVIDGTLTGVWASIVQECVDPATGKDWVREIGQTETCYIRRKNAYGKYDDFQEAPDQYEMTEDGEELLANARLWAAAPDLLEALEGAREALTAAGIWGNTITDIDRAISRARGDL